MFSKSKKIFGVFFSIILILTCSPNRSLGETPTYNIVIKGGTLYNPSTEHELEDYNIGIIGSKIERITQSPLKGDIEIDAEGMAISPGFVDLISYDPNYVGIDLKVLDGVTTNLAMHGGTEDPTSWYRAWGNNGVTTNFGASTFITRLRWPIVGYGVDAEMTDKEDIDKLIAATRKCIENGTLGISFSFEYVPGIKNEIKPLLDLAAEYNVPTFYHLRYSDKERGMEGIKEVIDYGKETNASIHIMHINSTGGTFVMEQALDMVNKAREEGLDITSCFYPYNYWATYIDSARFRPGWQERFNITYEDLQIGATETRITENSFEKYRQQHLLVAAHGSMPEEELIILLKDPYTMIGSDTIIEPDHNNHPRGAGAYSRVFGKYVREENILSIMDAIKKVSYFPAKRMESVSPSMHYKGRLEVGSDADITIFDPNTIIDKSTVKEPANPSIGVEYVLVNGVIVKDQDGLTNVKKPGKAIQSYFIDKTIHNEPIDFSIKLDNNDPVNLKSAYLFDNKIYLAFDEVFNVLDVKTENSKDGKIKVGNLLNFEIGKVLANLGDKEIPLNNEPIIYKENTYIEVHSLIKALSENYEINEDESSITLLTKKTNKKNTLKKPVKDKEEAINKDESNTSIYIVYIFLLVVLIAVLFLFRKKK